MKQEQKITIIVIAALVIFVFVGAIIFKKSPSKDTDPVTTTNPDLVGQSADISAETLLTIAEINKLSLPKNIFTDKKFTILKDISVSIENEDVGRENPFGPIKK